MYRPPVGIPRREQTRWQGWLLSLLAHLLLLLLVFGPLVDSGVRYAHRDGAGGAGTAGGGGGGSGDGGAPRVRFVQVAPSTTASALPPVLPPVTPPPVTPPVPPVVVRPPSAASTPVPAPPASSVTTATTGTPGAGAGTAPGTGAGTGSGGGTGSGEGTGKGSGVAPGTGGGSARDYPPTLKQFVLPPLPTPASVKGFRLTAWFDVDSTGKATLLRFTPTPDRAYNDRVRETLLALRFRPAVHADGRSRRDTVDIQVLF